MPSIIKHTSVLYSKLWEVFLFKNTPIFLLALVFVFYVPQAIYGTIKFHNSISFTLATLVFVSILAFSFFYYFFKKNISSKFYLPKIKFNTNIFIAICLTLYFAMMTYVCFLVPHVPLFSALKGAPFDQISLERVEFIITMLNSSGLRYAYSIASTVLVPFCILQIYIQNKKWGNILTGLFLFSLALGLEKAAPIKALLPFIIFSYNTKMIKNAHKYSVILVCSIGVFCFLAMGGIETIKEAAHIAPRLKYTHQKQTQIGLELEATESSKDDMLMQSSLNKAFYIINRVAWIPYSTAYDWLRFKQNVLHNENISFRAIHFLSHFTHQEYFPLEQYVFNYEYTSDWHGQHVNGYANTVYFIDAYVKFGWPGVILSALLLALIIFYIISSANEVVKSLVYVPIFILSENSLTSVMLSGGLGILILLALTVQNQKTLKIKSQVNFTEKPLSQNN